MSIKPHTSASEGCVFQFKHYKNFRITEIPQMKRFLNSVEIKKWPRISVKIINLFYTY